MTPYNNPTTASERAFNRSQRSTRVAIEQTFGRLKRRFHMLHSEVRMQPEKVCKLIGACGILHNIALAFNEPMLELEDDDNQPEVEIYEGPQTGVLIRQHITNTSF